MNCFKYLTRKVLIFFISLLLFSCANDSITDEKVSVATDADLSALFEDSLPQNHELEITHDVLDKKKIQDLIYGDSSPFNSSEEISPNDTSKKNSRNVTPFFDLKVHTVFSFISYMADLHKYVLGVDDTPEFRSKMVERLDIPESLGETIYFKNGELTFHENVNTSMAWIYAARPIKWIVVFNNDQVNYFGSFLSGRYGFYDFKNHFVLPANGYNFTQFNDKNTRVCNLFIRGGADMNLQTYVFYWEDEQ